MHQHMFTDCDLSFIAQVCSCAGALSSFLMPSVFGKPIGKGSGINLAPVNTVAGIPAVPSRPESQAALPSPTSLAQTKLGRYRSGTSPLIAAGPARPMQWGFSNGSSAVAERPKQSFELPLLTKGSIGSSRGVLGAGVGRAQTQTPQAVQYTPTSGAAGSRRLFGR